MACERHRRAPLLLTALLALAVALWLPTTGQRRRPRRARLRRASSRAAPATQARAGSDAVRILQRRLRRLGTPPGPIDGLYGPLTEGAVERFQQRHGLAVDGIVGRQTKQRLFTAAARPTATPAHPETQPGRLERKSPAPHGGAESAERSRSGPRPPVWRAVPGRSERRACRRRLLAACRRPQRARPRRAVVEARDGSRQASTSDLHALRSSGCSGSVRRPARSSRARPHRRRRRCERAERRAARPG